LSIARCLQSVNPSIADVVEFNLTVSPIKFTLLLTWCMSRHGAHRQGPGHGEGVGPRGAFLGATAPCRHTGEAAKSPTALLSVGLEEGWESVRPWRVGSGDESKLQCIPLAVAHPPTAWHRRCWSAHSPGVGHRGSSRQRISARYLLVHSGLLTPKQREFTGMPTKCQLPPHQEVVVPSAERGWGLKRIVDPLQSINPSVLPFSPTALAVRHSALRACLRGDAIADPLKCADRFT
jgi:hypothetical protein